MDSTKIKAAARKALMAAAPQYHAWSPQQQERFRATLSGETKSRVDAVLLQEVLGSSCTPENAQKIWNELPIAKLNPLNWAKLLTTGIGADWI